MQEFKTLDLSYELFKGGGSMLVHTYYKMALQCLAIQ